MYGPIADSTYEVYCSKIRKYRRLWKETQDLIWAKELTKMEAKVLAAGRELPKDKPLPQPEEIHQKVAETSKNMEVEMYLRCLKSAVSSGDTDMQERFKTALRQLGYNGSEVEVLSEPSHPLRRKEDKQQAEV